MLLDSSFLSQLDHLALVSRRMQRGQIQGERRSTQRGASVEFADFRTYSHGDDFRQIDWNAYARLEKLFIKLFVAEEDLTVHFLLDGSQSMLSGEPQKWRCAQQLTAALGYITLVGMDRVTTTILGATQNQAAKRPIRGKRQALPWFKWLEKIEADGSLLPSAEIANWTARSQSPGPLIVISDLLGDGWEPALHRLVNPRFDVTVIHLLSPQEVSPELEGDLQLIDSETGEAVEITADFNTLSRYKENLVSWQNSLRASCQQRGFQYVPINTAMPLEQFVLGMLRQRGVLR